MSGKEMDLEVNATKLGGSDNEIGLVNNASNSSGSNQVGSASNSHSRSFRMPALFDTKGKRALWGFLAFAIVLTGGCLVGVSLKKVDSTEFGLEYNVHNKQLDDIAKAGGLHAGPPGFKFIKFPSTFVTVDLPSGTCVSSDGLLIQFSVTFQYQMPKEWMKPAVLKYRNFDKWATVVEAAGTSAVQHTCSQFETTSYQNQRGIIQIAMEDNLRAKLEGPESDGEGGVYARAVSLQLREVFLPQEYKDAVAAKQAAAEDIELAKNQRNQALTQAQTALLAANEEAQKILDTAINDANVTITEATLKADEIAFAFSTEVDVIVKAKTDLNLTTEGVLAFMSNRLLASIPNLKVSAGEPARLSRKEEL